MDHPSELQPARVGRDRAASAQPPRTSVAVSFGSPASESGVTRLDLNDIFIRNQQATFMMRVTGHAMRECGIDEGDIVLVDRAITPASGHVVIAVVDHEFICRRLVRQDTAFSLCATDPLVSDIHLREDREIQLWGVVTTVMKSMPV
ncbi:MAG TPA: translesion error-prone DNA polymerase V autoproteolytic subunit [Burkholderiaceae bacterium]|nr:translesion error-prone DNA polymerase V autoproteolytic subunit [Burkholderiaceae bacterium]